MRAFCLRYEDTFEAENFELRLDAFGNTKAGFFDIPDWHDQDCVLHSL